MAAAVVGTVVVAVADVALAVAVLSVGVVVMMAGDEYRDRGDRTLGVALVGGGLVVALLGVLLGAASADTPGQLLRTAPGLAGVLVVGVGLVPLRGSGSRGVVKAGAALVFLGVLAAGVLEAVEVGYLLAGAAASVVAWDLGEHAINVGEQLGRDASTWRGESVHAAASACVAGAGIVAATVVDGVGAAGLSLPALALILVAVVLFTAALHD
ncbi:MAG: DUF7519 family protein [Halobacteriota archaeon]